MTTFVMIGIARDPDLMGSFTVGPSGRGAYAIIIITTNTTTFVVVLCVVALAVTSFVG